MTTPRFFGYGSLVNLATHDYPDPQPARLTGWRRVWRHTSLREMAFLSVEPCDLTTLWGVTAAVPNSDWAALDEREFAYGRRDCGHQMDTPHGQVAVYEVDQGIINDPDVAHPILLSYLDVVVQGYMRVFGAEGAAHFFDTTTGWNGPIRNDRAAPIYPRAQILTDDERATVDRFIAERGILLV